MKVLHPESDLRPWLRRHRAVASPYTAARIRESYESIPQTLSYCAMMSAGSAYDIGCGAGFDTFAIGQYFEWVVAIDSDRRSIREARRIVRRAGVSHIEFTHARVENYRPNGRQDFVFCNLMSHNAASRVRLLAHITDTLVAGGHLLYAEVTEGYPALEIHRAILRRDRAALVHRCAQVLNGFSGRGGFRFFASGSLAPLLQVAGLEVLHQKTSCWNGLPYVEKVICRKVGSGVLSPSLHADYLEISRPLAEAQDWFLRASGSPDRQQILVLVRNGLNQYLPFLVYTLMAALAAPARSLLPPALARLLRRRSGTVSSPDWQALEELDRGFIAAVRARAGLEGAWDD